MIYEKELHFSEKDYNNENYFPSILVVRRKKGHDNGGNGDSIEEALITLKGFMKI